MTDEKKVGGCVNLHREEEGYVFVSVSLRVLTYWDDDESAWVSLALEMDLRGYGDTTDQAEAELRDLVEGQISFALTKGNPNMINHPAEAKFYEMFDEARNSSIYELLGGAPSNENCYARHLSMPPPHVIAAIKSDSNWANG